jgi:hypothetical protein
MDGEERSGQRGEQIECHARRSTQTPSAQLSGAWIEDAGMGLGRVDVESHHASRLGMSAPPMIGVSAAGPPCGAVPALSCAGCRPT